MTYKNVTISAHNMMITAQKDTKLVDWGGNEFKAGLQALIEACLSEANLSSKGRYWLYHQCVHNLSNRLHIQQTLKEHPEILEVKIERPLFLVTLPRSGSTFLHNLLTANSSIRAPSVWEMWKPCPPPTTATYQIDKRIEQANRTYCIPRNNWLPDNTAGKNLFPLAGEIEECFMLLKNSFASFDYTFEYAIPSYQNWLAQQDLRPVYRYFKKQLQLLQWQTSGSPWILKCADHIVDIPALLEVFPDASIIHLHRHPFKMIPSLCYLQKDFINLWRDEPIDPFELGELCQCRYDLMINRTMSHLKQRKNPKQFHDLYYNDLVANPLAMVIKIFRHFDYPLTEKTVTEMQTFLNRTKKPKNPYRLSTYGLEKARIIERYAPYIHQYKLKL